MTDDDLKHMQDSHFETAKGIMASGEPVLPVGFVMTTRANIDKMHESGWGIEFVDPKDVIIHNTTKGDEVVGLMVPLAWDSERLFYMVRKLWPDTQGALDMVYKMAKDMDLEDPFTRVMRPFMQATNLDEKDVMAAMMRELCEKTDAFAAILISEAWTREVGKDEIDEDGLPRNLANDMKAVEVVMCTLESRNITRMVTIEVKRGPSPDGERDSGPFVGFGQLKEMCVDNRDPKTRLEGRLVRFLKPLPEAQA